MPNPIPTAFVLALALLPSFPQNAFPQSAEKAPRLHLLALSYKNNGQHVVATMGEPIEITLQSIGWKWGPPQFSSVVLQFEGVMLKMPPIPAGPTQVFVFDAVAEGETQVQIPYGNPDVAFSVTIDVRSSSENAPGGLAPDQANTGPWNNAWTNLRNDALQTFIPSLPRLARVEVELVVANPGPAGDDVTMTVYDPAGQPVAVVPRTVSAAETEHVLFVIPDGGLEVSPGRVYSIRLSSGSLFGWKYVMEGYPKGEALFNGKPLVRGARSTFLFRTFGVS